MYALIQNDEDNTSTQAADAGPPPNDLSVAMEVSASGSAQDKVLHIRDSKRWLSGTCDVAQSFNLLLSFGRMLQALRSLIPAAGGEGGVSGKHSGVLPGNKSSMEMVISFLPASFPVRPTPQRTGPPAVLPACQPCLPSLPPFFSPFSSSSTPTPALRSFLLAFVPSFIHSLIFISSSLRGYYLPTCQSPPSSSCMCLITYALCVALWLAVRVCSLAAFPWTGLPRVASSPSSTRSILH